MHPKYNDVAVIILAAGKGTRMKSHKAKVLHGICGKPMIMYVVATAVRLAGNNVIVVIGHDAENVEMTVAAEFDVCFALQAEQFGTGHAVQCALPYLSKDAKDVVIMCGDVPLVRAETIWQLIARHKTNQNDVTVLTMQLEYPRGYGRMLVDDCGCVLN
ncbi:MAG: NTP transferase domain-containing protein, partial [Deltaproteobacteria bacterium]|nr:NTP transferase domain-containing protein [Deltaproteobacteria bacterium]